MPVEDLEDHHGSVQHLAAGLLLQVERLRWGDLVVDQDDFGLVFQNLFFKFFPFTGPEVGGLVEPGALLREFADDLEPQRLRELAQLGQRGVELGIANAGPLHRRHDGARPLLVDCLHARSLSGKARSATANSCSRFATSSSITSVAPRATTNFALADASQSHRLFRSRRRLESRKTVLTT